MVVVVVRGGAQTVVVEVPERIGEGRDCGIYMKYCNKNRLVTVNGKKRCIRNSIVQEVYRGGRVRHCAACRKNWNPVVGSGILHLLGGRTLC